MEAFSDFITMKTRARMGGSGGVVAERTKV